MPLAIAGVTGRAQPVTGFVVAGNHLYIGVTYNGAYYVIQLDRANGAALRAFSAGTTPILPLTIGHQLLYVAGAQLWALDIADFELVWSRGDLPRLSTAPVYTADGANALAELYIAGEGGRVWALDANRGTDIRSYEGGNETANGLALGESAIYSYGNNFVRAYDRRGFGLFWRAPIGGDVRSLIVTAEQLVLLTSNGSPQVLSPAGNNLTVGPPIPSSGANGMAMSGEYIYIPGDNEFLYGFVGQ
jgi:outer membrane protein assembly factor BamB